VSARALADKFGMMRITQSTGLIKNKDMVLQLWKFNGDVEIKTIKRRTTKSINNIYDVLYEWFCKLLCNILFFFMYSI